MCPNTYLEPAAGAESLIMAVDGARQKSTLSGYGARFHATRLFAPGRLPGFDRCSEEVEEGIRAVGAVPGLVEGKEAGNFEVQTDQAALEALGLRIESNGKLGSPS